MIETAYHFGEAILPNKYSVCGVVLKPFCLGHLIILEQLQNPLVAPSETTLGQEGIYWLFHGVLVCSLSYEDNLKVMDNEKSYQELADAFTKNLLKNMEIDKNWNILSKLNLFKDYLKYHMNMPLYTEENSSGELPSGTDWKQSIFVIFKKLGYSETQILNMSMKKLFYEWCSYAEGEGALKVWSKSDVEQYKKIKGTV